MSPERWSQVKSLLDRALARPEHERQEFLRQACSGDAELYAEVTDLITAHSSPHFNRRSDTLLVDTQVDPRIGQTLKHRYRIKSRLGSGGVGVVYLAEDLHLMSRHVVVKFLHEHGRSEPGRLTKFLQEAEALARMDHPGIVAAFDADETPDGAHFLVMQYVDGGTLRSRIEQGPLPLHEVASIVRQLGSALEAAHNKGVIHRDLKPENIMLQHLGDGRDIVKLIDFGIARVEASAVSGDTAVIGVAGTPSYMAPEHISGKPVSASDIFSLGVIAFEMLTGKRPFSAKQPFALRQQHKEGVPPGAIRALRPEVPANVEDAIRTALRYNIADRPANAREFCDTIGLSLETEMIRLVADVPTRRRWLGAAIGGAAATATAGAGFWYWKQSVPRSGSKVLAHTTGAFDPADQGFLLRDKLEKTPLRNAERTGFDRLDLRSPEQGSYFKPIALEDMKDAFRYGWKITLRGTPVIGGFWAVADFHSLGEPRYDLSYYREPDGRALVLLCTQHVPTFDGPRYEMPDQGASRRSLELVFDPKTRTCELFVAGRRQIAGYKGYRQNQDSARPFYFGISVYRSDRAEAELEDVKFEIL